MIAKQQVFSKGEVSNGGQHISLTIGFLQANVCPSSTHSKIAISDNVLLVNDITSAESMQ